jgi:hypothetical protein
MLRNVKEQPAHISAGNNAANDANALHGCLFSVAAWVNQPRRAPLALHSNPLHRAHKI